MNYLMCELMLHSARCVPSLNNLERLLIPREYHNVQQSTPIYQIMGEPNETGCIAQDCVM